MCIAVARLSRRRTWHSSCATIAFNCSAVIRSAIPCGNSRTGRNIPNTPGSRSTSEDFTGTGSPRSIACALRTSACIRVHRRPHFIPTATNPAAHASSNNSGIRFVLAAAVSRVAINGAVPPNGWATCSITIGSEGSGDAALQLTWFPTATSRAKGTKNFIDAANHTQYRVCARFFRNASVSSHASPAKTVDCHKWSRIASMLLPQLPQRLRRLFQIPKRQIARVDQVLHDRLRAPAEHPQQIVDQSPLCRPARNRRLENMRRALPLRAPHRLLELQPVHRGLNGRVGRPVSFRKSLLNLPNRRRAFVPERLHNLHFQLCKFLRIRHEITLLYLYVVGKSFFAPNPVTDHFSSTINHLRKSARSAALHSNRDRVPGQERRMFGGAELSQGVSSSGGRVQGSILVNPVSGLRRESGHQRFGIRSGQTERHPAPPRKPARDDSNHWRLARTAKSPKPQPPRRLVAQVSGLPSLKLHQPKCLYSPLLNL